MQTMISAGNNMSERNTGGPAFPMVNQNYDGNWDKDPVIGGMTLRDWFATHALTLAAQAEHDFPCGASHEPTYDGIAARCYFLADAMLKARGVQPQ